MADIKTTLSGLSVVRLGNISRSTMSKKSLSIDRSWTSSTKTCVTLLRVGSSSNRFNNIPVVQNKSLVLGVAFDSKRIVYPTVLPIVSPRSAATRSATDMAEIRRGCAMIILHAMPLDAASSKQNWGTCVVFPDPVSPSTTVTLLLAIVFNSASLKLYTGRPRRWSPIGPMLSFPAIIGGGSKSGDDRERRLLGRRGAVVLVVVVDCLLF